MRYIAILSKKTIKRIKAAEAKVAYMLYDIKYVALKIATELYFYALFA